MFRFILLFGLLFSLLIGKIEAHTVPNNHRVQHLAVTSWFCYHDDCNDPRFLAASNTLPNGTILWLRYPVTGKSVRVMVVGTGPFVPGRVLDLSMSAAARLGYIRAGVVGLQVLSIEKPRLIAHR